MSQTDPASADPDQETTVTFKLTQEAKDALKKAADTGQLKIRLTNATKVPGSLTYAAYNWGD